MQLIHHINGNGGGMEEFRIPSFTSTRIWAMLCSMDAIGDFLGLFLIRSFSSMLSGDSVFKSKTHEGGLPMKLPRLNHFS